MVNHSGSWANEACARIRAIGWTPSAAALSVVDSTKAAAPSLILLELAAVTEPSSWNAGRSLRILSKLALDGSSSRSTTRGSPLRCGTSTGTISSPTAPDSADACARR